MVRTPRARGLPGPLGRDGLPRRAGRSPSSPAVTSYADLAVGPDPDDALAPATTTPRPVAVDDGHALDGRLRPGRGGRHGGARPACRCRSSRRRSTSSSWSASATAPPAAGAERLAALARRPPLHRRAGRSAAPGTPTNNSEQDRAGYRSRDRRGEQSFALEWPDPPRPRPVDRRRAARRRPRVCPAPGCTRRSARSRRAGGDEALAERGADRAVAGDVGLLPLAVHRRRRRRDRDWARDHARRHVRPAGVRPDAALRPPALRRAARHVARRLDRRRRRRPGPRRRPAPAARRAARPGVATGDARRPRASGAAANVDADLVDVLRHRGATSTGLRPAAGARPALPAPPAAVPRRGPRRASASSPGCGRSRPTLPRRVGLTRSRRRRPVRLRRRDRDASPCRSCATTADDRGVHRRAPRRRPRRARRAGADRRRAAAARAAPPRAAARPRRGRRPLLLAGAVARPAATRRRARRPRRRQPDAQRGPGRAAGPPGPRHAARVGEHLAGLHRLRRRRSCAPSASCARRWPRSATADPVARRAPCCPRCSTPRRTGSTRGSRRWPPAASPRSAAAQPDGVSDSAATAGSRTSAPSPAAPVAEPPPDEPGPLIAPLDDPGFIVAPSLDQATTAALLRERPPRPRRPRRQPLRHQAHVGPRSASPSGSSTASARASPLGTLLGYDVERRLHEVGLDELIDDVRRIAPPADRGRRRGRRRPHALDGLVLHEGGARRRRTVLDQIGPRPGRRRAGTRMRQVLTRLDAAVDAAADAVTAEGVHQLARGNLARAPRRSTTSPAAMPRRRHSSSCARRAPARRSPTASPIVLDAADAHRRPDERVGGRAPSPRARGRTAPRRLGCPPARPGHRRRRRRRRARRPRRRRRRAPRAAADARPRRARPRVDQR